MDNEKLVCLVTGANSGIGYASASKLAQLDATVILVCRSKKRGNIARKQIIAESGNHDIHLLIADLTSQQAVQQLITDINTQFSELNILINNAGAVFSRHGFTIDGIERTFALNHMAYFILANGLLKTLIANAPARIINVASFAAHSGVIDFDDLQGDNRYSRGRAYHQSKLANILFTAELARRTKESGLIVNCFNPGNVDTNLGGIRRKLKFTIKRIFFPKKYEASNIVSVGTAAEALVYLAVDQGINRSGVCFSGKQIDSSLTLLDDHSTANRLWETSQGLIQYPILN